MTLPTIQVRQRSFIKTTIAKQCGYGSIMCFLFFPHIVYSDEEHEIWRIYFLGEDGCEEEYGKLVFPDHSIKKPKNTRLNQLKNCIFLELGEFENIVYAAIEGVTVEYTLEGLDIYTDEDCVSFEEIKNLLTKHFEVEVTSFHSDHCEDNPGVWICYKDGSEVQ